MADTRLVGPVPPALVNDSAAWVRLEPIFAEMAEATRGRYDVAGLRAQVASGMFGLFFVFDENKNERASALIEFSTYPLKKVCRIVVLVGKSRADWIHHLEELKAWARDQGCTTLEFVGRKGWAKDLADYKVTVWTYEAEL